MFITKKVLPRRTILRGLGASLTLPFLDAMVPALGAAPTPVRRFGAVYLANGALMSQWRPAGDLLTDEMSPTLLPLRPFRDQVVVPIGLDHKQAEAHGDGNGDHSRASAVFLNGVHPKRTEGADVRAGTTADVIAASVLGQDTPLRSLEMAIEQTFLIGSCENGYSCAYLNTISWRTPTSPNPMEMNPRVIFQRLLGDGGSNEDRVAQLQRKGSLLDFVAEELSVFRKRLGPDDRHVVTDYTDSIREVEQRIQATEQRAAEDTFVPPDRPVGVPESFDDHAKLMFDLAALAFQADLTRVFTFMLGKEQSGRPFPEIGVTGAHHSMSHHGDNPELQEQYAKINTYQVELLAYFLGKLKDRSEGSSGTLLDNSLILYGGGISDGNLHDHTDLPVVLAGGGGGTLKGGRVLRNPRGTPMSNLLVAVLDKLGVETGGLGDATGMLSL
jgi:hypothetical protein